MLSYFETVKEVEKKSDILLKDTENKLKSNHSIDELFTLYWHLIWLLKMNKQKLELTWIGKDKKANLEPRILVHESTKSFNFHKSEDDQYDNNRDKVIKLSKK